MPNPVFHPRSATQIAACYPVVAQLRPHIPRRNFVARIRRQQKSGYHLVATRQNSNVVAIAGYRFLETLAWGRILYVDDLVTDEAVRSQGHGQRLMTWLIAEARRRRCAELHLDSGVQRFGAHRFYLAHRMDITCHHFGLQLNRAP